MALGKETVNPELGKYQAIFPPVVGFHLPPLCLDSYQSVLDQEEKFDSIVREKCSHNFL